jgi:hypothetical protein
MTRVMITFFLIPTLTFAEQAAERSVVVPKDTKPFQVTPKDIVRLTGRGIAGSRIEATVEGAAELERTTKLSERANGSPVVGNDILEFEIKPKGKGKVLVTITVRPPQPTAKPQLQKYEFDVQ